MAKVQRARDVLAKWRTSPAADVILNGRTLIPLVDGTAGNRDLLDAIDGLLAMVASGELRDRQGHAQRIAAAIIAADEKMNA